eukprot:jgi/Mesen1/9255/ME000006S09252
MASALSAGIKLAVPEALLGASFFAKAQSSTLKFTSFSGLRSNSAQKLVAQPSTSLRNVQSLAARAATTIAPKFTTMTPLADRVLVKIVTVEEKSQGGILLPTTAQAKPQGGKVIAVGSGRSMGEKKVPVAIESGSNIVYSKYAGTEVELNGESHLLMKEDDVIGILDSDDIKDLKPLNDRVLIKVTAAENKTAGGVLLTESAKEKPVFGTVAAVGPGALGEDGSRKGLEITPGSTVLYSKFAGSEFKSKDGELFVVLRAQDVMATLS